MNEACIENHLLSNVAMLNEEGKTRLTVDRVKPALSGGVNTICGVEWGWVVKEGAHSVEEV